MSEEPGETRYPTTPAFPAPPSPEADPPQPPPHSSKPRLNVWGTVLTAGAVALVVALIVGLTGGIVGYVIGRSVDGGSSTPIREAISQLPQAPGDTSPRGESTIAGIVDSVLPSVVSIMFSGNGDRGSGSGFVIREDGFIMTNNHVVESAANGGKLKVVFNDGKEFDGTIVGRNPAYDLAVVKVDRDGLTPVPLGNSSSVKVGDAAIAIGEPLGLDGTVTLGIVSALDRPVTAGASDQTAYINAIQTDAAINPGNSGGPLLDGAGQAIGVNSAIATMAVGGEGGSIGLGFAIPINTAKRIAEEIITKGKSTTPIIGVQLDTTFDGPGAKVAEVTPDGPAQAAGLKQGDIITKVNARPIDDSTELVVAIRTYSPGDTINLSVSRGSENLTVPVTLAADSSKS